jgi:DNA-binding response OmpR family regulator
MNATGRAVEFLLIDDDPGISEFLVAYLEEKGHSCAALTNSNETAAWLEHNRCEVAIVDLNMPQIDGLSLISLVHDIEPKLPMIVFTGLGYDEEKMQAALRAGANGYVSKNLPIEELYCALARVLATTRRHGTRAHRRPNLLGAA